MLNVETLKKIVASIPDDFEIEFKDTKSSCRISDKIEVDVSGKKLIFKRY